MREYIRGLKAGIPIGLGYLSVSFTFGIIAHTMGYYWWQSTLISMVVVTSAGQFAGITTMLLPGHYLEMLLSQLTINIRYSFMSISLGQKADERFRGIYRWLLGFFVTDEIFAVAVAEKTVRRSFFAGLATIPWIGWTLGTLAGSLLGNILPDSVLQAMGLALYGMFVAIVVPEMQAYSPVCVVVALAAVLSCAFRYVPALSGVPSGFAISICAVAAAFAGAVWFPVEKKAGETVEERS